MNVHMLVMRGVNVHCERSYYNGQSGFCQEETGFRYRYRYRYQELYLAVVMRVTLGKCRVFEAEKRGKEGAEVIGKNGSQIGVDGASDAWR
jgi:hypothetical protein